MVDHGYSASQWRQIRRSQFRDQINLLAQTRQQVRDSYLESAKRWGHLQDAPPEHRTIEIADAYFDSRMAHHGPDVMKLAQRILRTRGST